MIKQTEEERLNWLKTRLRSVAEGASMLDFAEKNNIPISFDPSLGKTGYSGMYHSGNKKIALAAECGNETLTVTLAHELRHAWQDHLIDLNKRKHLIPKDYIIHKRLMEGDAYAFENYLKRKLRIDDAPSFIKKNPVFIRKIFGYTTLTFQEEMEKGFIRFQKSSIAEIYDTMSLLYLKGAKPQHPAFFLKKLSDVFSTADNP